MNTVAQAEKPARARKPRPATEQSQFLVALAEMARDPSVPADKLGQIIGAQERFSARGVEQAFNVAFAAAQQAMSPIVKDAMNDTTMSRYARLETISQAIDPIIHAHGLSTSFGTADSPLERHYRVTCKVRHVGGHAETYQADVPADIDAYDGEADKVPVHAYGSSMTYGRRYVKVLAFDIVLKDEDNDGNPPPAPGDLISNDDLADLKSDIDRAGGSIDRLLRALKVETLAQLPAHRLEEAKRLIQARRGA